MRPHPKLLLYILVLSCIVGCGRIGSTPQLEDQTRFPWAIAVEKWTISSGLKGLQSELQYDGTEHKKGYEQKPESGMVFLILDLTLEKKDGSSANFAWKDVYLQDFQGKKHYRNTADGFLELFGMKRIKAVDLNFGSYTGSVLFEIPQQAARRPLVFTHETQAGQNRIQLK